MDKNIYHQQIESLLERIRLRHSAIRHSKETLSTIELDILLADLRALYEFCSELRNLPLETPAMIVPAEEKPKNLILEDLPSEFIQEKKAEYQKEVPPPVLDIPSSNPIDLFDELPSVANTYEGKVTTINDRILENSSDQSVVSKIKKKPITDLRSSIGINEKFIFINELFDSDAAEYSETIEAINACKSLSEADEYLKNNAATKHNWNLKNKFVKSDFMDLLHRRFL